jgi:poly(hydroxyalkanoate) depolymerase family esterase
MRRIVILVIGLALAATGVVLQPAQAHEEGPSKWGLRSFTAQSLNERPYWLYVPPGEAPDEGFPVVVALHGCTQTAPNFGHGAKWVDLAVDKRFVLVLPEQSPDANGSRCWNWFLPEHQVRDKGEPAMIAAITKRVIEDFGGNEEKVFVTGVSAGADMTAILAAAYPDLFRAAAPFAGCAYATCSDISGEKAYKAMGTHARVVPALVAQGTADPLNNSVMGDTLLRQQLGTADYADNGKADGSVRKASSESVPAKPGNREAGVCVRSNNYPCPADAMGWDAYPYTVDRYVDAKGKLVVESWIIQGLMHNYPGAIVQETETALRPRTTFVDPHGPDLTHATYEFFLHYRRKIKD